VAAVTTRIHLGLTSDPSTAPSLLASMHRLSCELREHPSQSVELIRAKPSSRAMQFPFSSGRDKYVGERKQGCSALVALWSLPRSKLAFADPDGEDCSATAADPYR